MTYLINGSSRYKLSEIDLVLDYETMDEYMMLAQNIREIAFNILSAGDIEASSSCIVNETMETDYHTMTIWVV